jgi:aspartyl-tRNA(Asn)/glutamyl-tRNA(Gln) amidotransferase subunit A
MDAADHELAAMLPRVSAAVAALEAAASGAPASLDLSASELLDRYRTGELTPSGVARSCLDALHGPLGAPAAAGGLGAIWAIESAARVSAEAAVADGRWQSRTARPLEGVPIVVKDLLDTNGLRTTGGSAWLAERVPTADAAVVAAVRDAGAIVIAKTATYELGCGNDEIAFGRAANPWDHRCTTGGSSAGSASALAARLVPLALGTDTGGSIRIPSSYCGVVGLKPTLGRLSCAGLLGLAPTLDMPGPMARTAEDVGLLFSVLTGVPPARPLTSLRGLRIGLVRHWFTDVLDPGVSCVFDEALASLRSIGAEITDIEIPHAEHAAPLSWLITMAEAARTYADAPRDQLTPAFRGRLEVGSRVCADDYFAALTARRRLSDTVSRAMAGCDVVVVPSTVCTAPRFDDLDRPVAGTPVTWPDVTARTMAIWNVTGLPSLTVPIGFADGLPVGMQIAGRHDTDETLIAVATAYQAATTHHLASPPRHDSPPHQE